MLGLIRPTLTFLMIGYIFVRPCMRQLSGLVLPSFVLVFNGLLADLMDLNITAPNNGTKGLLNSILKSPRNYSSTKPPSTQLNECPNVEILRCGDGCHFDLRHFNTDNPISTAPAQTEQAKDGQSAKISSCNRLSERILVSSEQQEEEDTCMVSCRLSGRKGD